MTENPAAVLYGPKGPIRSVAGVLVSSDVAAFSPWPAALTYRTPFAVRIIAADGSTDEWVTPKEVVYLRLADARENTNVAGVTLATHSRFPVVLGERVPADVIVAALEDPAKGTQGVLVDLGPDRFSGLDHRRRSVPKVAHPIAGNGTGPLVVPELFMVNTGPAGLAELSICRIFRWD